MGWSSGQDCWVLTVLKRDLYYDRQWLSDSPGATPDYRGNAMKYGLDLDGINTAAKHMVG